MSRLPTKYAVLTSESQDDLLSGQRPVQATRGADILFYVTCMAALVSSFLAVALALPSHSAAQVKALRRPSTYMGLERVLSNVSRTLPFPPIVNFPPVLLQIETADSARALHENSRQYFSYEGTVFPDDRRFVATNDMSTVAQFKNLDYGMERCTLYASIPLKTDTFDPESDFHPASLVDVWLLEDAEELSPYARWDNAPRRVSLLASFSMSARMNSSFGEFECRSGKFTTLEFACSHQSPNCRVVFWQKHLSPPAGVFITQQDSLLI